MGIVNAINNSEFFPTPKWLAEKMVSFMGTNKYDNIGSILEPSAGDGALIEVLHDKFDNVETDYIEKEESLRSIITGKDISDTHCVGDDFLTFHTYKNYECIIMNPPFSEGDRHLLKAIEMQKATGGRVIALINANTLRDPYSVSRKALVNELKDADIEYIKDAFKNAERKTDVEVALINVYFEAPEKESTLFEGMEKAVNVEMKAKNYVSKGGDYIEELIERFNFEVKATLKLADEYFGMLPYISQYIDPESQSIKMPILNLKVGNHDFSTNEYLNVVRLKYWEELFHNPQFSGMLTSNLREKFFSMINDMKDYDFNRFNIEQIMKKMACEMETGYENTIIGLFEQLSVMHYWTDEPENVNIHYYNGWTTNKSWKINDDKVIIPCYGFKNYEWDNSFDPYKVQKLLSDIEQTLNYLDNGETSEPAFDIFHVLEVFKGHEKVRNVDFKYFTCDFYKKGTCHIKWKNKRLVEKLNIYGSRKKSWLPPAYGTKTYKNMTPKEKAVIDEFQGASEYNKVMCEKEYFLQDNVNLLRITG